MHITNTLLTTLSLLPLLTTASKPKNAVLLSQVQTLTLKGNGAKTTHRRVSAIPQLKCVSSKAICDLYAIDVMRCTNQGSSYGDEDVEWSCTASLPPELKLGRTEVICEGYAKSTDPYVLKGSCGVEYTMALTREGEKKYPDIVNPTRRFFSDGKGGTDWSAWAFAVIFVAVLAWIAYSAWFAADNNNPNNRRPRTRRNGGGGGGGGGWGGWGPGGGGGGGGWGFQDDPPPYPGTKPSTSSQQQGWTPGFGTGFLSGAAAGYFAGNRNNGRNDRSRGRDRTQAEERRGWSWGEEPAPPAPSGSASSSSSSAPRESTGFGSTRRR